MPSRLPHYRDCTNTDNAPVAVPRRATEHIHSPKWPQSDRGFAAGPALLKPRTFGGIPTIQTVVSTETSTVMVSVQPSATRCSTDHAIRVSNRTQKSASAVPTTRRDYATTTSSDAPCVVGVGRDGFHAVCREASKAVATERTVSFVYTPKRQSIPSIYTLSSSRNPTMAQSTSITPPFTLAGLSSSATTEPVPTSTSHDANTTVEPSALSAVATAPTSTVPSTITVSSTTQYPAFSLASYAALPRTDSLATTFVSTTFITVQAAPAATSSAGAAKGGSRSPSQLILGVAVGGSTALIIVLLLIVLLLRRRRQNRNSFEEAPALPRVAQAPPLVVPLSASADPSGDPGTIIRALSKATSLERSLPQQAAITPRGIRLVPREEPDLTMASGESTTATRDFAVEGKSMEVPLVPPRNPLRPKRPKSRILATPPRTVRKAGTRLSTIPGSVASSPGHTGTANLTVPSGTQRSRTSSYTSLGARSDSVYSLDTNGQRRRSDPFSWQNVVAPHTPRPIPKCI